MMTEERQPLLKEQNDNHKNEMNRNTKELSIFFATLCIIDLFGVFPVVTMPRSIIDCGWLGIPLVFGVFLLQVYTALLLGRCWIMAERINPSIKQKSRQPYAALAEMTYGPLPGRLVTLLLDLTVFAGGVPNLLVASQSMQLLGEKGLIFNWEVSYCYWMPLIGVVLCPFMWLGSPKDMKLLVISSSSVVILVSLLIWTSIVGDNITAPTPVPNPSWEAIAIAYGILAFQFDIHPMILTVQVDMADKTKLGQAIVAGFSMTGTLFFITTILAAIKYGGDLEYNLLRSLPPTEYLDINVFMVTLQICLSTVVGCTTLFQGLEEKLGIKKEFCLARCLLRTSVVLLSVVLSEIVPRFDLIMGLVGGSMMGPLMFILPPLFYARLRAMEPLPDFKEILSSDDLLTMRVTPKHKYIKTKENDYKSIKIHDGQEKVNKYHDDYYRYFNERLSNYEYNKQNTYYSKSSIGFVKRLKRNAINMLSLDNYPKIGPMVVWERFKIAMIVCAGILATLLSTYYSLRETIKYARFTPPCFVNVTAATLAVE